MHPGAYWFDRPPIQCTPTQGTPPLSPSTIAPPLLCLHCIHRVDDTAPWPLISNFFCYSCCDTHTHTHSPFCCCCCRQPTNQPSYQPNPTHLTTQPNQPNNQPLFTHPFFFSSSSLYPNSQTTDPSVLKRRGATLTAIATTTTQHNTTHTHTHKHTRKVLRSTPLHRQTDKQSKEESGLEGQSSPVHSTPFESIRVHSSPFESIPIQSIASARASRRRGGKRMQSKEA
jgi:hypothetical protein